MARHTLTEDEHIFLNDRCNDFWKAFGRIVADQLVKTPIDLQDHLLVMLEDRASVHGSGFDDHMDDARVGALKELDERIHKRAYERLNLCPDHRDKTGDYCIVCQAERRTREKMRAYHRELNS